MYECKIEEVKSENNVDISPIPSFLTGKDSKVWYKSNQNYYNQVFKILEDELTVTDTLIYIVYIN